MMEKKADGTWAFGLYKQSANSKDLVLKDHAPESGGLSREEFKVTFQEDAASPHAPAQAQTYTAFESE